MVCYAITIASREVRLNRVLSLLRLLLFGFQNVGTFRLVESWSFKVLLYRQKIL